MKQKMNYEKPTIEVMNVRIEKGYAGSGYNEGTSEPIHAIALGPYEPIGEGGVNADGKKWN